MTQQTVANLAETRQVLIFGGIQIADDYCADTGRTDPFKLRYIQSVVIDEILVRWYGRPFDVDAQVVANEALSEFKNDYARITALLRERGFED